MIDPLTIAVGLVVILSMVIGYLVVARSPRPNPPTLKDAADDTAKRETTAEKERKMPKARKDKGADRLHADGPPPVSATEKAKVKEQEVLKAPAAEPKPVVEKPASPPRTAAKTPEVEKKHLEVPDEGSKGKERNGSPAGSGSGSRRKNSGAAGTPPQKGSPSVPVNGDKEVKDPLQIKIIEQEDDSSSDEDDDDEDDAEGSPNGKAEKGSPAADPDGWTIPSKDKERIALGDAEVSRSAPELQRLAPEDDDGHIEYKLKLVNISDERFEHLLSQMQWRLSEGQGKAIYRLGVTDSGEQVGLPSAELDASIETVKKMATQLKADVHLVSRSAGLQGETAELLVEKRLQEDGVFSEVRVAVVGNVDSGKSTLLGVLSKGILDNGRGLARLNVFRHKHEVETGRTSDISKEILGFNDAAQPVNYSPVKTPTWPEICEHSSKVVMFMDLAGHEKYLKTTVFGLTGNYPDYTMMIVGSNMGVVGMTKEHYQLTLALKIPVFMVVTKIDICPPNVLEETMSVLTKMLKAPGSMKMPVIIKTREQAIFAAKNFTSERLVPIFQLSSVTGECLDVLRYFLYLLPSTKDWDALLKEPVEFFLDNTFSITGVGTVVSGTLMRGIVKVNQNLLIGPDEFGKFQPVQIKGIHTNRLPVKFVRAGQSASFALKKFKRKELRKGMAIVDAALNPQACWEFDAEILIITHSTTITKNYEAVIHCGCTRQTAKIVSLDGEVLRSGHRATVRFRYKQLPEYLKVGERLIFREGKTKGIGRVAKAHPIAESEQKQS